MSTFLKIYFLEIFLLISCPIVAQISTKEKSPITLDSIPGKPIIDQIPSPNIPFSAPSKKYLANLSHHLSANLSVASINPNGSAFNFIFNPANNIPQNVQDVFIEAGRIWSEYIFTGLPFNVYVNYKPLPTGILGSASPSSFYKSNDFMDSADTYYPVALIKKRLQYFPYQNSIDIHVDFNSDFSQWYIGTGTPASNQYDLLTVALHELGHGLGISGFFTSQNNLGKYFNGTNTYSIFDALLTYKKANIPVIQNPNFPDNSSALQTVLTSDSLFLNHSYVKATNNQNAAQIYAPAAFSSGSSIYHLNESTYPVDDPNTLMTPFIAAGQATREIGPIIKAYAKAMGYTKPEIVEKLLPLTIYPRSDSLLLEANAYYPYYENNLSLGNAFLYYAYGSYRNNYTFKISTKNGTHFSVKIPVKLLNNDTTLYFYWKMPVFNSAGTPFVNYFSPPLDNANRISVDEITFKMDNEAPVISKLSSINSIYFDSLNRKITLPRFQIMDSSGIEKLTIFFQFNHRPIQSVEIPAAEDQTIFDPILDNFYFEEGDTLHYYIEATEWFFQKKISRYPLSGMDNIQLFHRQPTDIILLENLLNKNIQLNSEGSIQADKMIQGKSEVELKGQVIYLNPGFKVDAKDGVNFRAKPN